jgi:hypothetical protein
MPFYQFAVTISIAILFPMLVHDAVSLIRPFPHIEYRVVVSVDGGMAAPERAKAAEDETRAMEKRLNEELDAFDEATRPYFQLLFFAAPLGLAAMLVGSYTNIASIGTGLIFGGMITVADGYAGYWDHLDGRARFVSLLIGFGMVIFVVYRRLIATRGAPP